ncbi:Metallo-dependent phosphatase-like protein [Xylariomycetidae sp. FL2044]|nr:Metallo-dependent phosphatase-like protein [Xylariomycetidae sp. FL2044]
MKPTTPRKTFEWWATLIIPSLLAPCLVSGAPTEQKVLQVQEQLGSGGQASAVTSKRKLHGRFLHITDLHPDEYYQVHSSTEEDIACHRGHGPAGTYGAETSDCDSPLSLVNATLDWITANLKDEIDFVVWTGDSARHDSDQEVPRHNRDVLDMNRRMADRFLSTFSDDKGLVVPVVPTFGNNDIYPHNILMPGPNDILKTYTNIWKAFIPEAQRHSFEFGGWFYTEVVPNKLAVFSLNTMYFFDRNAGIDDCASPSEPGYKHFEWLRIQLDFLRTRGMKAILMGHVPPARTSGKQLWDETCWQKYTLWLQQYRDVVAGALYGHMNIDHFLLQDTKEIDMAVVKGTHKQSISVRESLQDEFSIESSTDYLRELREDWSKLPDPVVLKRDLRDSGKKKKKGKKDKKKDKKIGGPWAERYQLTLISPSIVPNYFPSIRVFEYNITGLEDTQTWLDSMRSSDITPPESLDDENHKLELREESGFDIEKKKKNGHNKKGKKGKKGKKPKDPNLHIPDPPKKGAPPGPAYYPQPLTLTGFTQYYANLTYINNDIEPESVENDITPFRWDAGKNKGKKPKHNKPKPNGFAFEVEYTTFEDKLYKLNDLTVKSLLDLAYRIGQASTKSKTLIDDPNPGNDENEEDIEGDPESDDGDISYDDEDDGDGDGDDDDDENDVESEEDDLDIEKKKGKKHKDGKKKDKKKKKKHEKVWLHFLNHAFVSTRSKEELKGLD